MKKLTIITSTIATGLLITILTGCNIIHKPDINGSDRQPIMHGWTFEQAGEFWLQSDLDGERIEATSNGKPWMTAEELASFDDEHVQVKLPIAPEGTNPLPRNGIAYSQEGTGGFIKFNINPEAIAKDTILRAALTDAKLTAEQLMTVGYADIHLQEPLYFNEDSTFCCYVQQRGRGIYTLYYIADRGTRYYPNGTVRSSAAVISVYPGADSLCICRGNMLGPDYKIKE